MAKVRLVKGPFGGRVMDCSQAGSNRILITGPKPMTRKEKWHWQRDAYAMFNFTMDIHGDVTKSPQFPVVRAEYRLAERLQSAAGMLVNVPCMHPDGSLFYEYVENSRKEY